MRLHIADIFYDVSNYSQSIFNRRINIVTDTFAVNTDETDLGGFKHIPKDKSHRILIGNMSTFGHGVGKINTDAAEIIKSVNSVVIDTVLRSAKFHESDAVLVIAAAAAVPAPAPSAGPYGNSRTGRINRSMPAHSPVRVRGAGRYFLCRHQQRYLAQYRDQVRGCRFSVR
jgi:hypothetical protein